MVIFPLKMVDLSIVFDNCLPGRVDTKISVQFSGLQKFIRPDEFHQSFSLDLVAIAIEIWSMDDPIVIAGWFMMEDHKNGWFHTSIWKKKNKTFDFWWFMMENPIELYDPWSIRDHWSTWLWIHDPLWDLWKIATQAGKMTFTGLAMVFRWP